MRRAYHGRRAVAIENDRIRVTVLEGGGHIAEILDKATGVNPLWTPPWPSIEPEEFDHATHPGYGGGPAESRLLSAHHGSQPLPRFFRRPLAGGGSRRSLARTARDRSRSTRSSTTPHRSSCGRGFRSRSWTSSDGFRFTAGRCAFARRVENLTGIDRPVGWTQHVTLGPPFIERGVTEFRAPATRSKTFESAFGSADYLTAGAEFDWPMAPADRRRTRRPAPLLGGAGVERVHRASDGSRHGRTRISSRTRRAINWRSATSGTGATFRGSASGRKTPAAPPRPGTAPDSRAAWSSACRRFRKRDAR